MCVEVCGVPAMMVWDGRDNDRGGRGVGFGGSVGS